MNVSRRRLLQGAAAGLGALAVPRGARALFSPSRETLQMALVRPVTKAHLDLLGRLDTTHRRVGEEIEVLLWSGDRALIDAGRMPYRITDPDVLAAVDLSPTGYRRLADYENDMRALAAAHPTRARFLELPHPSREGRPTYGIEIAADVNAVDGRPVFYMDGLHHAREWPSGEVSIMFADDLLASYAHEQRIRDLLAQVRVVVIPVINPDGFDYSREAFVQVGVPVEGYWRKSRRTFGDDVSRVEPQAHAARPYDRTVYGVDLNRNYPYHFGGPGSSWNNLDQTHTGPWPFEPEIANGASIYKSRHVTASISNHTYSELVLRPWGDTWADPRDEIILRRLGDDMAEINGYWSIKSVNLYAAAGVQHDWAYAGFSSLAYTFELGQGFHPDHATTFPGLYERNRGAFLLAAEAAADPAHHGIIRGSVPAPARITLRKTFFTPWYFSYGIDESLETVLEIPAGAFEYHVNPSTRPIAAGPEHYGVEITSGPATRTFDLVIGRGQVVNLGAVSF